MSSPSAPGSNSPP